MFPLASVFFNSQTQTQSETDCKTTCSCAKQPATMSTATDSLRLLELTSVYKDRYAIDQNHNNICHSCCGWILEHIQVKRTRSPFLDHVISQSNSLQSATADSKCHVCGINLNIQ